MKENKPLTQADIDYFEKISNELGAIEGKIISRIDYIFDIIFKAFGQERPEKFNWYFPDADEGEMGTIELKYEQITFTVDCPSDIQLKIETPLHFYTESIPRQFLFMKDEEIINYIHKEIKAAENKKEKRKEAAAKNKAKREAIKNAAISKLTAEEKKVLGI